MVNSENAIVARAQVSLEVLNLSFFMETIQKHPMIGPIDHCLSMFLSLLGKGLVNCHVCNKLEISFWIDNTPFG